MSNKLSNYLVEQILLEDTTNPIKKTVVVYAGRFQPFHVGHNGTYQHLVKKFGKDNVFIGTSNKVEKPTSPFNFKEKVQIMTTMFGIPKKQIVEIKNPYKPTEILSKFDEDTTAFVTVVGLKDKGRLGGKYFTEYDGNPNIGYRDKGYVYIAPVSSNISGTDVRNNLSMGNEENKKEFFTHTAYKKFNANIFKLVTDRLSESFVIEKETIENWLLKEGTINTDGSADDGPAGFFPNMDVFHKISIKRAKKIGYDVINMIMTKDLEDYYEHPEYPTGPVKAVSFYPAGVIGHTTPNNQIDIYSSDAYSEWFKHVTRKASLAGYELITTQLEKAMQKKLQKISGKMAFADREIEKEFELFVNEAITLPVEIGDTLLMGKFKNKKVVVKDIGTDEHGMPTINGKKVVTFRLDKKRPNIFERIVSLHEGNDDDKYTHIGYGKYKLKGKEKDTNSPTFKKDGDKFVQMGSTDTPTNDPTSKTQKSSDDNEKSYNEPNSEPQTPPVTGHKIAGPDDFSHAPDIQAKEKEKKNLNPIKKVKKIGDKIKNWSEEEKQFFRGEMHKPGSEIRRDLGDAIKHKAKGILKALKHGAKHEIEEFKTAGKAAKTLANGQPLSDHEKKALKSIAIKVVSTAIFGAMTGGLSHGIGAFGKHVAMELAPHVVGETILKGVGRAALFAGVEEDEQYLEKFMNAVSENMENMKITPEMMHQMIDSYNEKKQQPTNENLLTEAKNKLKISIPSNVKKIVKAFKKNGKKVYIVGGAVRDAILGKTPHDFDLSTDAQAHEMVSICDKEGLKHNDKDIIYGTVIIDGEEVTQFRKDIGTNRKLDGIDYTDIEGDVRRRDLTINALFYDIDREEIVDLVGGIKDLQDKKIRTVGKAVDRFEEDHLRKLRAIRFTVKIGGTMDPDTLLAIKQDPTLKDVSANRIRMEFMKCVESAKSTKIYLDMMEKLKFLELTFPGLKINKPYIDESDYIVLMAQLLKKNSKGTLESVLNKINYTKDDITNVTFLISLDDFTPNQIVDYKKEQKRTSLTDKQILDYGKHNNQDYKKFIKFNTSVSGKDAPKDVKGKEIGTWIQDEEKRRFLNEDLKHQQGAFEHAVDGKVPITDSIMNKILGKVRVQSFHITDMNHLKDVTKMVGSKKSISTFDSADKIDGPLQGTGMWTKGGIIVFLDGKLLAKSWSDLWSKPDKQGRRWVHPSNIFPSPGSEYGPTDPLFDVLKTDRYLQQIQKKFEKGEEITGNEKNEFLDKYIKNAYKLMLKNKSVFIDTLKDRTGLNYTGNWNEVVVNDIKIKEILIIGDYYDDNEIEKIKKEYGKVVKVVKSARQGELGDVHKYFMKHGGYVREDVNSNLLSVSETINEVWKPKDYISLIVNSNLPISEPIMKKIIGEKLVTSIHVTDLPGYIHLKKLQGKSKSLATFNTAYEDSEILKRGLLTGGGLYVVLQGNLLLKSYQDIHSNNDKNGRRWLDFDDVFTKNESSITRKDFSTYLNSDKEYSTAYTEYMDLDRIDSTGKKRERLIKRYFELAYDFMLKYKDEIKKRFDDNLKNPPDSRWDELIINKIKIVDVIAFNQYGSEHIPENVKQYKGFDKDLKIAKNKSDLINFIKKNGGLILSEMVNPTVNEAQAVKGNSIHKLITGKNLTYKGTKYPEIDFEVLGTDNRSQVVKLRILSPKKLFGEEMNVPFRTIKRGPFLKTDTKNMFEMAKQELNAVEKYADKLLDPTDVEFSSHFFDRLNDPRNGKEITYSELVSFFKRLSKDKKQLTDFLKKYKELVITDKKTKINMPLVSKTNQIIAKTVMRKDNWQTSNPVYKFESKERLDELAWQKSAFELCADDQIPLSPNLMKKLYGDIKINAFHITNRKYFTDLVKLQGKSKAISVFTSATNFSPMMSGNGIQTNGGILAYLEGTLLLESNEDIMSRPDKQGRRWTSIGYLTGRYGDSLIPKNKRLDDLLEKHMKVQKLNNDEKREFIELYIKDAEKWVIKNQDNILKHLIKQKQFDSDWNEILVNKIKLKKVLVLISDNTDKDSFMYKDEQEEIKFMKKQFSNIETTTNRDDFKKFINKNGGKLLESINGQSLTMINEDRFIPDVVQKPKTWYRLDTKDVLKISDNIIKLVQTSYQKTKDGSFVNSKSDLQRSVFWNAIDIDGDADADAVIFGRKTKFGIKLQGIGHDGERQSKDAVVKRLVNTLKTSGYWVEASDALESILYNSGIPYITSEKVAKTIFPDSDLKMTGKKGQYTRKLPDGKIITETIFGKPKVTVKETIEDIYDDINELLNSIIPENNELITEGGAYGHMNHPFDTEINLTFGQLKDIVNRALDGNLEFTREKTDGQALAISWKNGKLVAARNKGHLKNRGEGALDINGIASKFQGRGGLSDAYNFAMQDLSKAIGSLSDKQKQKIFKEGENFMNLEVIYPTSVNVIPYGQALLVFHGTMQYNEDGIAIGEDAEAGKILAGMIKQVNQHVQDNYTIQGPPVIKLPKNEDLSKNKSKYISKISKLQKEFNLKDSDGVADYHQAWWTDWITKNSPTTLDNKTLMGLVKRWAFFDKSFRVDNKSIPDEKTLEWAKKHESDNQKKISKDNLMKFEDIFLGVGADVLQFTTSVLTVNPDKAIRDMKKRLDQTIKDVKKSGDEKNIEKLKLELRRLNAIGGVDKLVPSEGIVFVYNGNVFKLTGTFASLNQLLGIFYA